MRALPRIAGPSKSRRFSYVAIGSKLRRGTAPLLQEVLGRKDPWRVATCCVLLNRTSRVTAEPVARELFRRWPTAKNLAIGSGYAPAGGRFFRSLQLKELIAPLGLSEARSRTIMDAAIVASGWLSKKSRRDRVDLIEGVDGIGPYAMAAMRAFCLGDLKAKCDDGKLMARLRHLRRGWR